ncbi:MAG: stage III sporulation protein AG [Ruminococcus sp.]|nr:stage III sporulation protein AG [Ruminococcus sp.]
MEKLKLWCGHPKLPNKTQLLTMFLVGILLLVVAWPMPGQEPEEKGDAEPVSDSGLSDEEAYQEYLEKRIARALEQVEGVGRAEVVITLKSTAEKVVEKDQVSDSQTSSEADSVGGTRTIDERSSQRESVYEQRSDGTQTPYVRKELTPEIGGVLIVCDGGDNAVVIRDITEAVQALFGVEAHKIKIMKRTDT